MELRHRARLRERSRRYAAFAATVLIAGALACSGRTEQVRGGDVDTGDLPARTEKAPAAVLPTERDSLTQTQMRNVHFQVAPDVTLRIRSLRGEMVSRRADSIVVFDDKNSFVIRIASGEIALGAEDLSRLIGNHVFGYPGSPLRDVRVEIKNGELVQRGKLRKGITIPFEMTSVPEVTPEGLIRVRPKKMKMLGLNGLTVMRMLGLRLSKLVDLEGATGVTVKENDLYLDPEKILPPPAIRGHLVAVRIEGNEMVQVFKNARAGALKPIMASASAPKNYMAFRGGTLQFGKLYMVHADMVIQDQDPKDAFRFSIDSYNRQLIAGFSKNEPDLGLRVTMPDLNDVGARRGD